MVPRSSPATGLGTVVLLACKRLWRTVPARCSLLTWRFLLRRWLAQTHRLPDWEGSLGNIWNVFTSNIDKDDCNESYIQIKA